MAFSVVLEAVSLFPPPPRLRNVNSLLKQYPSLGWIAPFAVFMLWLAVGPLLPLAQPWESIVRVGVLALTIALFSGGILRTLRIQHFVGSVVLGLAVCAMWVAPDLLIPGWRSHWLFQNSITGTLKNSIAPSDLENPLVMSLRFARAALLVPILEELFWRGWLPRWIVNNDWEKSATRHLQSRGVSDHGASLRVRARPVLGSRLAVRPHLQLVDVAHEIIG